MPRVADPASSVTSFRGVAEHNDEDHNAGDGDEVVEHRRPRERPEDPARVEHFAEQAVDGVEQHLRQTPVGESGGEGDVLA
jgi:hypothetical protein